MMLSMIGIIRGGKFMLIDEIDTSLHTQAVVFVKTGFKQGETTP